MPRLWYQLCPDTKEESRFFSNESMPTYGLPRELCISVWKTCPSSEWAGHCWRPPEVSAAWWVGLGQRPCLLVHSVEHLGARLFCSGLWIRGAIQALESHAGLLHEPWSLFLFALIYVHLLTSGINKLGLAWPLDIFSSLNAKSFTFIIKRGVGQGLRQSIAGCKRCTDPMHVASRSVWVPDHQKETCSEAIMPTAESYLTKLLFLWLRLFFLPFAVTGRVLLPGLNPTFSSSWCAGGNPINKN